MKIAGLITFSLLHFLTCGLLAANLIPNSSFECGAENWVCYGSLGDSAYGNDSSVSGRLTSTNKVHGNISIMWRTRLFAQALDLRPGSYVLTYSGMASLAASPVVNTMPSAYPALNLTNGCSNPTVSFGTSWARYTNFITVYSNDFYSFKWYLNNPAPVVWLDAVQLETGTVASAYSPMAAVEVGLATTNINHIINAASPNYLQLKWWNNGGTVTATSIVQVVNHENTNILAATTISTNALPAGATTINVTLPDKVGWMRATSYQPTVNNSLSELICFIRPYAASKAQNTNGVFGSHPNYGDYSVQRDREAGYTFSRDLSPAGLVRWSKLQPNGTGPFQFDSTFTDYYVSWFTTNGTVPLLVLTPGLDGYWPPAATNSAGEADINAWSNYAFRVAARYSPAPSNCWYYEVGNEPHHILAPTDFSNNSSNLARFQVAAAQAVRAACPNCTILGLCGESVLTRGWETWTNMSAPEQALFNVISAHLYPVNQGSDNPNNNEDDLSSASRAAILWKQQFASTGKPLWNTEMGNQGHKGGFLGPLAMHNQLYRVYVDAPPTEAVRDWGLGQRKVTAVCRESRQILRSLGVGFAKVFGYTSAVVTDDIWAPSYSASSMEFSGAPRQAAAACLIAGNYFARNPGMGRITNVVGAGGAIEAYYFTNDLGTVVSLWSNDQSERTMTLTNGNFGYFEVMGNLLETNSTTVRYGRTPTYLVSGSLSTAQLKATVEHAVTAAYTDVTGPNISIDQSPIGVVSNGTYFFKWTLTDKNKQVWSIGIYSPDNTNNLSRVKFFEGDSWRDCGESNHFFSPFTINRQFNLIVEGKDFYNNVTTVYGPAFGILVPPSIANELHVSGTARIGTITVP